MGGLGSNLSPKKKDEGPQKVVKPLKWYKPKKDAKYGKNIAIVGQPMAGKTLLSLSFGFFNSKYKKHIREAGFHKVIEVMDAGILPEIEKIVVLESENNLRKALNDGVEKALFTPFINEGIIDIIPITVPRKSIIVRNNKLVDITKELLEEKKNQYKDTVKQIVDEEDEGTLFIIDSATKYKKLLDDRLGTIIDTIQGRKHTSLEGLDKYTQVFYSHRNTEWENLMEYKRGFKGWNIDTYKESKTPGWVLEKDPTADPLNTKWVNGTEHFLDMIYRITALSNGDREISIMGGKGRYLPEDPKDWKPFKLPLKSRLGAMPLIDLMCKKLLMGEVKDEGQFWNA